MDKGRWEQIQELFQAASELPEAARAALLEQRCGADTDLRTEVERLLSAQPRAGFLEPPTVLTGAGEMFGGGLAGRVFGGYRLVAELGRGGMGVVYEAEQLALGRRVALKLLPLAQSGDAGAVERFRREARSASALSNPGLVPVLDYGESEGICWYAMQFVAGHDLQQELVRQRARRQGDSQAVLLLRPFDEAGYIGEVVERLAGVADALQAAHDQKVVHRDVKPSNVLLDERGHMQLADFGLARDESLGSITRTDQVQGTPYYMSPEQARTVERKVDHRTDVYSLGVVLYEALSLMRPFEGRTSRDVIHQIATREARPLRRANPRVPHDLAAVCAMAMEKRADHRYPTAARFAEDMRRFLRHEATEARPPSPVQRAARWVRLHGGALSVALGLVIAILVGIAAGSELRAAERADTWSAELERVLPLDQRVSDLPLDSIALLAGLLRERDGVDDDLAADVRSRAGAASEQLAAWLTEEKQAQQAERAALASASLDPAVRQWRLSRLQDRRRILASMFPNDAEVVRAATAEATMPRVSVTAVDESGASISALVLARRIDLLTGQPGARVEIGAAPVVERPLEPGYYRIVVAFEAGGFREHTRYLESYTEIVEIASVRRDDEERLAEAMVRFEAAPGYVLPASIGEQSHLSGDNVPLEAFLLDETEVSNREYERFLAANPGQRLPRFWEGERPDGWGDLPAVGMSWEEALAYAEWAGKRLPTMCEWLRAGAGLEGRLHPWLPRADGSRPDANTARGAGDRPGDLEGYRRMYLEDAAPVRSFESARTPEGLYHMYGNVHEFTETMAVRVGLTEPVPLVFDRRSLGKAWDADRYAATLLQLDYTGIGRQSAMYDQGFRCARSAER